MPLQLPNLDNRSYDDLVTEARGLIPTYEPRWTNHNASDPGITLIELFAYLTEMLIYRLNRVTDENLRTFLKLLNGPGWSPQLELREEVRLAVLSVRERYRAITCDDFEFLSTEGFNRWLAEVQRRERNGEALDEWWRVTGLEATKPENFPSQLTPIARAHCLAQSNLDRGNEADRRQLQPGHVSVIIVPRLEVASSGLGPQPTPAQYQALRGYLDERRTLAIRHHVVGPFYAPVSPEIVIARYPDAPAKTVDGGPPGVYELVEQKLKEFLSPLPSEGQSSSGWPFGHDLFVSELYEQLERIRGVDYLSDIMLTSQCQTADQRCVEAEPLWHENGDFTGLRLFEHHLPAARVDPSRIVIAPNTSFLAVRLEIRVTTQPGADLKLVRRMIKIAMKPFFHPLYGGPRPESVSDRQILLSEIKLAVERVAQVASVVSLAVYCASPRLLRLNDVITGVQVNAGEVVDLQLQVEV